MSISEKTKGAETAAAVATHSNALTQVNSLVVVDLDKRYTKKQIKKLREGRGKLMTDVSEIIQEMAAENALPSFAQPIVIVVREKLDGWDLLG